MKFLFVLAGLSVLANSAFAEAVPGCVSGVNVVTGDHVQICGIVKLGAGCYSGTNVVNGEYVQVCGANAP